MARKVTLEDLLPLETLAERRPLLTVAEAACVMRCDPTTVRSLLEAGELEGARVGRNRLVLAGPMLDSLGIARQGARERARERAEREAAEEAAAALRRAAEWWEAIGS